MKTTPKRRVSRDKVSRASQAATRRRATATSDLGPDTRSAALKAQAHHQSLIVARSAQAQEDHEFNEAISWD